MANYTVPLSILDTFFTEMDYWGAPLTYDFFNLIKTDIDKNIPFGDVPQLPIAFQVLIKNIIYAEFLKGLEIGGIGAVNAMVTLFNLNKTDQYDYLNELMKIAEDNLENFPGLQLEQEFPFEENMTLK